MDSKRLLPNVVKFNVEQAETILKSGDKDAVFKLAEHSRKEDVFEIFYGYSYASKTSNLLQFATRHTEFNILKALFEYLKRLLGSYLFDENTKEHKDAHGKDILAIAAKYRCDDVIWYILGSCSLDYDYYPADGKGALYYLLHRKKEDLSYAVLSLMQSRNYVGVKYEHFFKDMLLLKQNISLLAIASPKWIKILTREFCKKGRVSNILQPVYICSSNFSRSRKKQLLRHIAFQFFCRWKYHLGVLSLKDVQIMCVTPLSSKENPYPKPTLFISLNPINAAYFVREDFRKKISLKEMLTRPYQAKKKETTNRSQRYAKKLAARVWGSVFNKTTTDSRLVSELLKIDHRNTVNINNQDGQVKFSFFRTSENELLLLLPGQGFENNYSHAEDTLCDTATALQKSLEANICIYGKRRPCMSCFSRMKCTKINHFNFHPGFLHENVHAQQPDEVRKETASAFFSKPSFITQSEKISNNQIEKRGSKALYSYDTASDSE